MSSKYIFVPKGRLSDWPKHDNSGSHKLSIYVLSVSVSVAAPSHILHRFQHAIAQSSAYVE